MYTQKDRREFGFVPGEYEYTPPDGIPAEAAENIGPGEAVEFDQPAPEITGPGEYVYEASAKKKHGAAKLAAIMAAITLVLGASNPFAGPEAYMRIQGTVEINQELKIGLIAFF